MYLHALDIKEGYYGKDHNEVAMTLNNLALVYAKMNQYQRASKLYLRALIVKRQYFGEFHPDIALFLFNLGTWFAFLLLLLLLLLFSSFFLCPPTFLLRQLCAHEGDAEGEGIARQVLLDQEEVAWSGRRGHPRRLGMDSPLRLGQ